MDPQQRDELLDWTPEAREAREARRRAAVLSPALRLHIWRRLLHAWSEGPGAKWFDARAIPLMPVRVTAPEFAHSSIRANVMDGARWPQWPSPVPVVRRQPRRQRRRRRK